MPKEYDSKQKGICMSRFLLRTIAGLLLAAVFVIGAAANTAVAEDGACGDPNTVVPAE
jgi:hypothetical protein